MTALRMHRTPLPATDDLMEFTSDVDRGLEANEDIDIDLDLTNDGEQDGEDEYMDEDDSSLTDQVLGVQHGVVTVHDDEMGDDDEYADLSMSSAGKSSVHDEDLEDVDCVEPVVSSGPPIVPDSGEDISVEAAVRNASDPHAEAFDPGTSTLDSNHENQEDHALAAIVNSEHRQQHSEELSATVSELGARIESPRRGSKDFVSNSQDESKLESQHSPHQSSKDNIDRPTYLSVAVDGESREVIREIVPAMDENHRDDKEAFHHIRDGDLSKDSANKTQIATEDRREFEEIGAPLATESELRAPSQLIPTKDTHMKKSSHVHPILVLYQDNEMFLFPPFDQDEELTSTYFLQDEQLASESINNLFEACRAVLGESISDQDELTIEIEDLGLLISESTPESSSTTLADLINIYIHLQHYDGFDDPPPFYMNLISKARFSHRVEFLMNALAEERGLSYVRPTVGEEPSKLIVDGASSPRKDLESHEDEVLSSHEVETSDQPQGELTSSSNHDESVQTTAPASVGPSRGTSPSVGSAAGESNYTMSTLAPRTTYNAGTDADGVDDALKSSKETQSPSPTAHLKESDVPERVESTVDEGDFIDYEDDEGPADESSSQSSTLQGDNLNNAAEGDHAMSKRGLLLGKIGESRGAQNSAEGSAEETVPDMGAANDAALIEKTADHLDKGVSYPEYSEEEYANTPKSGHEDEENIANPGPNNGELNEDSFSTSSGIDNEEAESFPPYDQANSSETHYPHSFEAQGTFASADGSMNATMNKEERWEEDQPENNQFKYEASTVTDEGQQTASEYTLEGTKYEVLGTSFVIDHSGLYDHTSKAIKRGDQVLVEREIHSHDENDNDEITYDDEEDAIEDLGDSSVPNYPGPSSPSFHKRARSQLEIQEDPETELQDSKRVRIE